MYSIVHPITNKELSIFSNDGKLLLKNYIKYYQLGGALSASLTFGDNEGGGQKNENELDIKHTCLPQSIVFFSSGHIDLGDGNIRKIVIMGERHDLTDKSKPGCLKLHEFMEQLFIQFKKNNQCLDFYGEVDPQNTITKTINKPESNYVFKVEDSILPRIQSFKDEYKGYLRLHGFDLRVMSGQINPLHLIIINYGKDIVDKYCNIVKDAIDFEKEYFLNKEGIKEIIEIITDEKFIKEISKKQTKIIISAKYDIKIEDIDTYAELYNEIMEEIEKTIKEIEKEIKEDFEEKGITMDKFDIFIEDLEKRFTYIRGKIEKEYKKLPENLQQHLTPSKIYEFTPSFSKAYLETDIYTMYRLLMPFDNTPEKENRKGYCEHYSKNCLLWGGTAHMISCCNMLLQLLGNSIITGQINTSPNMNELNELSDIINENIPDKFVNFQEFLGFYGLNNTPNLTFIKNKYVSEDDDNIKMTDDTHIFTLKTPLGSNIIFYSCDTDLEIHASKKKLYAQTLESIHKLVKKYKNETSMPVEFYTDSPMNIIFDGITDLLFENIPEKQKSDPKITTRYEEAKKMLEEIQLASNIETRIARSLDEYIHEDNDMKYTIPILYNDTEGGRVGNYSNRLSSIQQKIFKDVFKNGGNISESNKKEYDRHHENTDDYILCAQRYYENIEKSFKKMKDALQNDGLSEQIKSRLNFSDKYSYLQNIVLFYQILSIKERNVVYIISKNFLTKISRLFNTDFKFKDSFNVVEYNNIRNNPNIESNSLLSFFQLKDPDFISLYDREYINDNRISYII